MQENLKKYQTLAVKFLRQRELKAASADPQMLQEAQDISDVELLRKWLWKSVIISAPVCFLIVPFVISMLSGLIGALLTTILWNIARVAMAVVFALFLFAIYFTTRESIA